MEHDDDISIIDVALVNGWTLRRAYLSLKHGYFNRLWSLQYNNACFLRILFSSVCFLSLVLVNCYFPVFYGSLRTQLSYPQ